MKTHNGIRRDEISDDVLPGRCHYLPEPKRPTVAVFNRRDNLLKGRRLLNLKYLKKKHEENILESVFIFPETGVIVFIAQLSPWERILYSKWGVLGSNSETVSCSRKYDAILEARYTREHDGLGWTLAWSHYSEGLPPPLYEPLYIHNIDTPEI